MGVIVLSSVLIRFNLALELWPNRSVTVANKAVDRQVKAQCLDCGLPEVQEWAKRWLSGEDRTYAAAYVVAVLELDNKIER